jgi:Holliday junction resolvasome RuvABC endonuclease subunit
MITLGLDPSLTGFGWCVHRSTVVGPGRVIAKGALATSAKKIYIWRYMFLRKALGKILDEYPEVEAVGVESPPFGEIWSEGLYGLFLYVNEALFTRRKDVVYFDPLRVKALAKMDPSVRRGRMDKGDMVEAAKADTQIKRWNHNEADAYIIARSAARFWEFFRGDLEEDELTPSEQQVFTATHTFKRGQRAGKTVKKGVVFKEGDRFHRFSLLNPSDVVIE